MRVRCANGFEQLRREHARIGAELSRCIQLIDGLDDGRYDLIAEDGPGCCSYRDEASPPGRPEERKNPIWSPISGYLVDVEEATQAEGRGRIRSRSPVEGEGILDPSDVVCSSSEHHKGRRQVGVRCIAGMKIDVHGNPGEKQRRIAVDGKPGGRSPG